MYELNRERERGGGGQKKERKKYNQKRKRKSVDIHVISEFPRSVIPYSNQCALGL